MRTHSVILTSSFAIDKTIKQIISAFFLKKIISSVRELFLLTDNRLKIIVDDVFSEAVRQVGARGIRTFIFSRGVETHHG